MSGADRRVVLSAVRQALGAAGDATTRAVRLQAVEARLGGHAVSLVPARAAVSGEAAVAGFITRAEAASTTVARVDDWSGVPAAIADYLRRYNLPMTLRLAPHPDFRALDWIGTAPALDISEGAARAGDAVSVNRPVAAVAETATLLCHSAPVSATTLNFLPDTSIMVLHADEVLGSYEQAWAVLRQRLGFDHDQPQQWPRTVNWISGPSRTADIEQTIQLGAHGPRRLHVVLVGCAAAG